MIPEIALFSLVLALCLAILLSTIPLIGVYKSHHACMQLARPLAQGQCFFIALSLGLLAYSFYNNDFSVGAVAHHSNSTLGDAYKIAALWGAHEGSLLLWTFILSFWTILLSVYSRSLPLAFVACLLSILGILIVGFLVFLLFTSNPFVRLWPIIPVDGRDLNPLLQDPGLIIHPPILYMGYAGFALPFAFTVATLVYGKLEDAWLRWLRPWVLVAFGFLTVGIALGSWWAYYELGWGGWWFWDPVENASFMPWLIGIALIHALLLSEKSKVLIGWTLLLAIVGFILTLIGLCLVRSGILTSVHAFASDPARGFFMFIFLALTSGGALLLYALRINKVSHFFQQNTENFPLLSRENFIFLSTVFLMVNTLTILLGTLFPLLYEFWTSQKISVGFPYFNAVFIPLMVPFLFLIPLGPISKWSENKAEDIIKPSIIVFLISLILSISIVLLTRPIERLNVGLGLFLGSWILLATLNTLKTKIQRQGSIKKVSMGAWGMVLAHAGIAISCLGITVVSNYQLEREVRIKPGDSVVLADYHIAFLKTDIQEGSNYMSYRGVFSLKDKTGKTITELFPEKRVFLVQKNVMTETAIEPGLFRDIYIALGDKLEAGVWTARIYYKPFVRWIWLGALMIALGSILGAVAKIRGKKAV
jgi:cytochrome c-type biogenesis protein CcmF